MFGDIAFIGMVWLFVELLEPSAIRVARGRIASAVAFAATWLAWIFGGFYYVFGYPADRPLITKGSWSWGDAVFMEVKENIFLFGPFLVTLVFALVFWQGQRLIEDQNAKRSVLILSGFAALGALTMAVIGMTISLAEKVVLLGA